METEDQLTRLEEIFQGANRGFLGKKRRKALREEFADAIARVRESEKNMIHIEPEVSNDRIPADRDRLSSIPGLREVSIDDIEELTDTTGFEHETPEFFERPGSPPQVRDGGSRRAQRYDDDLEELPGVDD